MMYPNIIIIIIDALRARNIGCYGYDKPITPNIDKLAKDSLIFDNAFSTINTTDPSLTTILTGRYPSSHGITAHGVKLKEDYIKYLRRSKPKFIQEILNERNYKTVAIDWLSRWHKIGFNEYLPEDIKKSLIKRFLKKIFNISPSFLKEFLQKTAIKKGIIKTYSTENFKISKYLTDQEYTNIAINKIREFKKNITPFFIFLHYWSVHMPYDPPTNYLEELQNLKYMETPSMNQILNEINGVWKNALEKFTMDIESSKEMLARYDACIKFVDNEIGRILTTLKDENIFDNTIILVTSDHGESLLEHGIYFDHHGLYDETIIVPLIVKFPKIAHKRIAPFIQHIDIVPSILDYLNFSCNENFDGKSFIPLIESGKKLRDYIYIEEYNTAKKKAIRTKTNKYIYSNSKESAICNYCGKIHGGIEELYDLKTDPGENFNLIKEKPQIAKEFKTLLKIKISQILEQSKINQTIMDLKNKNRL